MVGTAKYDPADEWKTFKLVFNVCIMLIALALHETRPYKRMNYGDVVRERGRESSQTSTLGIH